MSLWISREFQEWRTRQGREATLIKIHNNNNPKEDIESNFKKNILRNTERYQRCIPKNTTMLTTSWRNSMYSQKRFLEMNPGVIHWKNRPLPHFTIFLLRPHYSPQSSLRTVCIRGLMIRLAIKAFPRILAFTCLQAFVHCSTVRAALLGPTVFHSMIISQAVET